MRRCFKVTVEEVEMKDLRRGDLFILQDEGLPIYEDGRLLNLALTDADKDGKPVGIKAEPFGDAQLERPITVILENVRSLLWKG